MDDSRTLMPPPSFSLRKKPTTSNPQTQNESEDTIQKTTATNDHGGDKDEEPQQQKKYGLLIPSNSPLAQSKEKEKEDDDSKKDNSEANPTAETPPKVDPLYTPPYWSAKPSAPFKLEVLKNGTLIETIDLNTKGHYLFGRLMGDILLDHQSISRQHAVIQFRANPEVAFLYDLGSSHGTFVNKKQIKPKSYHPLKNGDMLRFGVSTRFYVFSAPEPEVNVIQQKDIRMNNPLAHLFTQKSNAKELEKGENSGVSWGIMDNDEEVYESAGDQIYVGGDDDLIDLEAEFDDDEKSKKKKKKEKETKAKEKEKEKGGENEDSNKRGWADDDFSSGDDSDDYFDRTDTTKKKSQKKKKVQRVETHESLIVKREELKHEQQVIETELNTLERANEAKLKEVATTDSLDAFMISTSMTVTDDKIKKLKTQLKNILEESTKLDKLISFTQPAFQKTPRKPEQGETSTKITTTTTSPSTQKTNSSNNKSNSNTNTNKTISIQKLFSREEEPERKKGIDPKHLLSKAETTHSEKSSNNSNSNIENNNNSNNNNNPPKTLAQQILLEAQSQFSKGPTLTFDDDNNNNSNNLEQNSSHTNNNSSKGKSKAKNDKKEKEIDEGDMIPKYEEWVPPENQTGSGRTKLNDLYGY